MKRKGRGRKKKGAGRGARPWLTVLLFFLIGFFAVSIYMGRVGRPRSAASHTAQPAALELPPAKIPEAGSPTVVVLNGCGRVGLGGRVERWLRRSGIDVFETRNADNSNYAKTIVVARSSRVEAAEQVEEFLKKNLGVGVLITERKSVPEADVLLILGQDFPDSLPGFSEGLAAPER